MSATAIVCSGTGEHIATGSCGWSRPETPGNFSSASRDARGGGKPKYSANRTSRTKNFLDVPSKAGYAVTGWPVKGLTRVGGEKCTLTLIHTAFGVHGSATIFCQQSASDSSLDCFALNAHHKRWMHRLACIPPSVGADVVALEACGMQRGSR